MRFPLEWVEEGECKHRLEQAVQNRILARKGGLKPRESVEKSTLGPKDRAHLYADGHGRAL